MLNMKKYKFNEYCKMYAELFKDEVPQIDDIDYISLQKKVINKLDTISCIDRQHIEVILKNNIHEFKDGSIDIKSYFGTMLGFFSGMAISYLKNFIEKGTRASFSIFNVIYYGIIFFIIYTLIIDVVFNIRKVVKSGFYEWCFILLDKFENGKFDKQVSENNTLKEVAADKEEDIKLADEVDNVNIYLYQKEFINEGISEQLISTIQNRIKSDTNKTNLIKMNLQKELSILKSSKTSDILTIVALILSITSAMYIDNLSNSLLAKILLSITLVVIGVILYKISKTNQKNSNKLCYLEFYLEIINTR